MKEHQAQLGSDKVLAKVEAFMPEEDLPIKDKMAIIQARLDLMTNAFMSSQRELAEIKRRLLSCVSLDKKKEVPNIIPGTILTGTTKDKLYLLMVISQDRMLVGTKEYPSLSAAAEAVSGVRRSGWTFWHTEDGRTAKEAFNK